MKSTDNFRPFVSTTALFFALLGTLWLSENLYALPLDSTLISGRTYQGNDADNKKTVCTMELGSIRRSPSNKRFRHMKFTLGGNAYSMIDFDPKTKLMLTHYNPSGWYGYDIWFRNYGDDSHFMRIWMNYAASRRVPTSLQLFSKSKKTGVERLLSDCINIR